MRPVGARWVRFVGTDAWTDRRAPELASVHQGGMSPRVFASERAIEHVRDQLRAVPAIAGSRARREANFCELRQPAEALRRGIGRDRRGKGEPDLLFAASIVIT